MDQKFFLTGGLTNAEGSLLVATTAQIRQSGRLLMSNPDSCKIIAKSDQRFLRRRFFYEFLHVHIVQKAPNFTRAMFTDGSKLCEQFLKRVRQGTFL